MKLKSILLLSSALLVMSNSFGQHKVTTGGKKYTLVEEGTGPLCGYCPDGAQDIEQSIEPDTSFRAVIASWHGTLYDATNMVVPGNPFCSTSYLVGGYPTAIIDRTPFSGVVGQSRPWESYVSDRSLTTPNFDVSMSSIYAHHLASDTGVANAAMVTLTITITGKALSAQTGTWNVNVFITEDSISSATGNFQQHSYLTGYATACNGQPNWFYGLGSIIPAASYSHMNVVRAVLGTGGSIFGDAAFTNPASGATFSKTYTYKFDSTVFNPRYMKVIGMVQKPGPASNTTGNTIENVIQARVRLMPASATAVNEVHNAMAEVTLYPNPAKNRIIVKGILENPSDTRITIYNSIGQTVFQKNYNAGGSLFGAMIATDGMSNGTYFMSIINNGESVTKEFTISK